MDLEKLNKSQIVLLTLLISFVTSIATGIVSVALMEQAPPAITQTVNRVVERTIEKVASSQTAAAAAMTPTPASAPQADGLAAMIAKAAPSVVRLYAPGKDEAGKDIRLFVGTAIVADANGVLIADPGTPDAGLTALRSDGVEVPVSVIERPKGVNMIRLQAATTTGETNEPLNWKPIAFAKGVPALGTAVVTIAGRTNTQIARGVITRTSDDEADSKLFVDTDIAADEFAAGSPLLGPDGTVVAVATRESRAASSGGFLASSQIVLQNAETEGGTDAP